MMDDFNDFDSFGMMGALSEDTQEMGVLRVPKGVDMFRPKEACVLRFAFVPYITSKNRNVPPGKPHYVADYFVFRRLGPNRKMSGIDAAKTFGRPCAITESLAGWVPSSDDEKKPKSQHMTLANIYVKSCSTTDKFNKKVCLFEHAFANFFEQLMEEIKSKANSSDSDIAAKYAFLKQFAHPVHGCWITATFKEETFGGHKFYKAVSFDFDKHGGLPSEVLAQAQDLEAMLIDLSYEEQERMFLGKRSAPAPQTSAPAAEQPVKETPKAQEATAPKLERGFQVAKGTKCYLYEKPVEVRKVADGVANVEDEDGEPFRVNVSELTPAPREKPEAPAKETKPTPKEEPAAQDVAEAPWDAAWDK